MSAGSMNQSAPLSKELLETLGDYTEALKGVKTELKDLEKEARRIEKKGGVVSGDLKDRLAASRGASNRLEQKVAAQKAQKKLLRDQKRDLGTVGRLARGGVRLDDVVSAASAIGGKRAGAFMTRLGPAAKKLGMAVLPVAIGIGLGKAIGAIALSEQKLGQLETEGTAQVSAALAGVVKQRASGASTAKIARIIIANISSESKRIRNQALTIKNPRDLARSLFNLSPSERVLNEETKAQLFEVRRAQLADVLGPEFRYKTSRAGVRNNRGSLLRLRWEGENSSWAEGAQQEIFGDTYVHANFNYMGDESFEKIVDAERQRVLNGEVQARAAELDRYNNAEVLSVERALVNEKNNAIRAFEADKITRGVTWALQ